MSEKETKLSEEELEQAAGGRNEIKRRRNIYNAELEERRTKTQGEKLTDQELEQASGGRNEVKRRRNIYRAELEERKLKTQSP